MEKRVEKGIVPPTVALILAVVAYSLCITAPFTFDDIAIFTAEPVTRPLTWLSYRFNGTEPWAFHAVNLVLHLLAVWLFADTLPRVLPERAAYVATLVFAVHPAVSEAVNYVWARSTLLMTVFCLLCLRDWLRGRVWLATAWFALALGAKEEAVAFPVVLALLERRRWKPLAAMAAIAAAAGLYTLHAANTVVGSQAGAHSDYSPLQYLASEGLAVLRYVRLTVVPWGFTVDPTITPMWWPAWIAVLVLAGFAARRFGRTQWGFWAIAALILLLPTSSVLPANDLAAERRMYLPMVAGAAALGLLIPARFGLAVALVLTALSAHRTWVWSDNVRLWTEAVEASPEKLRPRVQLARALPAEQALAVLEAAKKIAPEDPLIASELGRTYLVLRQPAQALAEYGRALAANPGSASAISNRGTALAMLKQDEAARADFERALQLDPCSFEARVNLKALGVPTQAPTNCRLTPEQRAALD
jgi:hypothetical protein